MKTLYSVLGMISFAGFVLYYVHFGIPLLLFVMFFAILYKLEELKK